MASTKLLLSFHTQLKEDLCDRVGLLFCNTLRVRSMLPKTFFRAFIQERLRVDHVFEEGFFFQKQLLSLCKRNLPNKSHTILFLRQVQIILEYTILTYIHTHKKNAHRWLFATEFTNIEHQHILRKALNEYFSPRCIDTRNITIGEDGIVTESNNPLEIIMLPRAIYEQDLFTSLVRHICVSSISKISQCKRDIYYWLILRGLTEDGWSNRRHFYVDQESVSPSVAFTIRRIFEHIGYLKHSIYDIKSENIWGAIFKKRPPYQRSFFSGLVEGEKPKIKISKKCNHIKIETAVKELGYLYLYDDKKKSDLYKEYTAVLAMMTTIQNPHVKNSVIYCDSRLNHNFLEKTYDNPEQFPIYKNDEYTLESTTTAVNKVLSWALSSQDCLSSKADRHKAEEIERPRYRGESNADDPFLTNSDDYESCRILTESFILEFLHWSSCQPPGLPISKS